MNERKREKGSRKKGLLPLTKSSFLGSQSVVMWTGFFLSISAPIASAQPPPSDSMRIHVDYARFRGDARTLYVELYYAFSQRSLTYREDSSEVQAGVDLSVMIHTGDSLVFADRWIIPHKLSDVTTAERNLNLVAISAVQLPYGDHRATLIGCDRNNPRRCDTLIFDIPVRSVDTARVVLSDIELATSIVSGSEASPFYKNTLEVIPNVQGIFGEEQVCFFYAEAYNLLAGTDRSNYLVRTVVLDGAGREVVGRERPRRRTGESSVIVDQIPVNVLPTGTYTLGVAILDSSHALLTAMTKKFFVYNPTLGVDSSLYAGTGRGDLYSGMSEGDLNQEFAWAKYERLDQEVLQYEGLTGVESKAAFLADFWKKRPASLRGEYLDRVAFANTNYKVLGREGYKTDRGRVHIIYGLPDDYERHPNEQDAKAYEIWTYNSIQGGVVFVFVQRVANGQYELVHSTHRNEIHDDQWFQRYAQTMR